MANYLYTDDLIAKPYLDVIFKKLFTESDEEEKGYPLLRSLVSSVMGIDKHSITSITIITPELTPAEIGEKFCRVDLRAIVDGRMVDIEVQVNDHSDFKKRSQYYWSRMFSTALPKGAMYISLPETVVISFLKFKMFDCEEYHSEFHVLEKSRHERLDTCLTLHFIEMPKLPKDISGSDELGSWSGLIDSESRAELNTVKNRTEFEEVQTAISKIDLYNADDLTKYRAEREIERLREEKTAHYCWTQKGIKLGIEQGIEQGLKQGIEQGIEQGIAQGIEQGIREGKLNIAKALMSAGESIEKIAAITELTREELAEQIKQLQS